MIRDEEIEASLRRFRAGQPSRDLLAAAQHRLARRTAVRDLVGGCCIAVAAVFAGFTMLAISVVRMDERIEEALADPLYAPEIGLAVEAMGGGRGAIAYVSYRAAFSVSEDIPLPEETPSLLELGEGS